MDEELVADFEPQEPPLTNDSPPRPPQEQLEESEDEILLVAPSRPQSPVKVSRNEENVKTPRRRRQPSGEPTTPAMIRRTRSSKTDAPPSAAKPVESEASSSRRVTRASVGPQPSPAPHPSTSKAKRRKSTETDESTAPSPAKRTRRSASTRAHDGRRSASVESAEDEPAGAEVSSSTFQVHHHHSYPSSFSAAHTPTTRSRCHFARLKIRDIEFRVPSVRFRLFLPSLPSPLVL